MDKPKILWDNEITDSTISSSAEDVGYPDDNVATWREYDFWQAGDDIGNEDTEFWLEFEFDGSAAVPITCVAIIGHNLFTEGARYKFEGSNNPDSSTPTWISIVAWTTPDNDLGVAHFFSQVSYESVKLTIDNGGNSAPDIVPQIGLVFIGQYLEFESFLKFPFDEDTQRSFGTRQKSESGHNLGHAQSHKMREQQWKFLDIDPAWFDSDFLPFWDSHSNKPFISVWDSEDHPEDVYLMWFKMDRMTAPRKAAIYRGLTLQMEGRFEE